MSQAPSPLSIDTKRITMQNEKHLAPANGGPIHQAAPKPAKLPIHSRAAAAQRLAERPPKPAVGTFYYVPHKKLHPDGWRVRRYLKRKNLRRSNQQYAAIERIGTQWAML